MSTPPALHGAGLRQHRATTILVLGILSLVITGCGVGVILGILAWVMGNNDLAEMDAGRMDPSGRDATNAGKICGMISVILSVIGIVIALGYFFLFMVILAGASGRGP